LVIILKLTEILNLPIKIHGVPIFRETNGLAMSSRNEQLSTTQRETAKIIHEALLKVNKWFRVLTIPEINQRVKEIFEDQTEMTLEYFTIADERTLKETISIYEGLNFRAFIAVFIGDVRLIDNIHLD
jgi:pantoate--beta-alanine ligase